MAFSAATTFCGGLPSPRPIKKHRPDHRAGGYDRGLHPHGVQHGDNVAGNHVCKGVPSPRPIKKRRPGHRAGGYDRGLHPHGVQHGDNVAGNHVCKGVPSSRPIKKHVPNTEQKATIGGSILMAFSAATTSPAITSAKGCPHRGPSRSTSRPPSKRLRSGAPSSWRSARRQRRRQSRLQRGALTAAHQEASCWPPSRRRSATPVGASALWWRLAQEVKTMRAFPLFNPIVFSSCSGLYFGVRYCSG
jgi:hypothetical protein